MYNILLFYCSVSEDFIIFRNRNRLNKYLFFFSVRFMYSTIWGQWKFQTAKFNVQKKLSSERSADFLKRKRNTFQEVNKLMGNADGHENSRRDRKARDRDVFIGFLEKRKKFSHNRDSRSVYRICVLVMILIQLHFARRNYLCIETRLFAQLFAKLQPNSI